jgi:hypothetical protein
MLFTNFGLSADFTTSLGRMTLAYEDPERDVFVYLHVLPWRELQFWGLRRELESPHHEVGLGPLALLCWWL